MRRTGCGATEREQAEIALAKYLAQKYQAKTSEKNASLISLQDVLLVYSNEHCPTLTAPESTGYAIDVLARWWARKRLAEINKNSCREYLAHRVKSVKPGTVRRELAVLNAAVQYWHETYGPLNAVPIVTLPPAANPRERWLTRSEAARLLGAALGFYRTSDGELKRAVHRINRHLARMILLGLYTGSRRGVLLSVGWDRSCGAGFIDFDRGVMHRRAEDAIETKKRKPPVKLGRKILAHLRRWYLKDMRALADLRRATGGKPVRAFQTVVALDGQSLSSIRTSWESARSLAGLDKKVTPHTLRHTRATWMMRNGVDMWEAAGALGMTVKTLEDVYGHHHSDFQANAAEV
ncbi:tyrosine-type recombinase/integrase (plasmid) [Brucella anthropi]|uniref:tyrosine-type recombinase/integrase n=1 Tax=Brucella anthropi TaxID=529 RepID=UPI003D7DCE8E